jgi:hypothetical protein
VFALTAIAFVCWKSPLADPALAAWNALGLLPLARVVDYTDWIALLALIPAYHTARRHVSPPLPRQHRRLRRRALAVAGAVAAVLGFSATSIARPWPIPDLGSYEVPATRDAIAEALQQLSLVSQDWKAPRRTVGTEVGADTLVVVVRQPPERRSHVWVEVTERTPGESTMRLVAIMTEGPRPTMESLHRAFAAQVHAPLLEWLARRSESPGTTPGGTP